MPASCDGGVCENQVKYMPSFQFYSILVSLFDEQPTGALNGSQTRNHLPGCNVPQMPQCAGYKDISP